MKRFLTALIPLALLLAVVGCSNSPLPTNSDQTTEMPQITDFNSAKLGDPADLVGATLHLYVDIESAQRIDVHRVTADWDECTVTHNNFGGAFDPSIEGSFMADGMGWRSVDVTNLVAGWMAEDYANQGLLLNQDANDWPRTLFYSREGSYPPFLEIAYMEGDMMMYDTLLPTADVYIYEYFPDSNFCDKDQLWTGAATEVDLEKQALLTFEMETTPPSGEGCTYTIGYWKRHSRWGRDEVSQFLPLWLGTPGGSKSLEVDHRREAFWVLTQHIYGHPSNGITKLYAQLLAAKLNMANGADGAAITDVVAAADAFLANHSFLGWRHLSAAQKQMVLSWHETLDDYNNGEIGPGHCDDGGGCRPGCGGHDDDDDDDDDDGGCGGRGRGGRGR